MHFSGDELDISGSKFLDMEHFNEGRTLGTTWLSRLPITVPSRIFILDVLSSMVYTVSLYYNAGVLLVDGIV